MRLLVLPIIIILLLLLMDYKVNGSSQAALSQDVDAAQSSPLSPLKPVIMQEQAQSLGVQFEHARRSYRQNSMMDMYGNGVCVMDFDNDGFEDILMVAGQGSTRRYGKAHWWNDRPNSLLYRNHQGQYFTPQVLTHQQTIVGFGCTLGDLNHDGIDDVVIGDIGQLHILINKGQDFDYIPLSLNEYDWPTSMMITDINQDSRNDIVVATLVEYRNDLKVGDQSYGYQARSTIDTSDYTGQNNLLLLAQPDDRLAYQILPINGKQRTLSLVKADQQQVLAVNAKGSNSIVQGLEHSKNWWDWLTFAAVQISELTVYGKPYILIANHGEPGVQLLDVESRLNQAWSLGLTNERIDAMQSWANVIADFNNDGTDDVFLASGYEIPGINAPSRPEGSTNSLILQDDLGHFHQQTISYQSNFQFNSQSNFHPNLSRASRGAASGDFNNDGFIDLVVMNNNNFVSLYLNQGNDNHWISFSCQPSLLCKGSQWTIAYSDQTQTTGMDQSQPYLSHNSTRVHFGLASYVGKVSVKVETSDRTLFHFSDVQVDDHYRINLATQVISATQQIEKPPFTTIDENWLLQLLQSPTPAKLLAGISPADAAQLTQFVHSYISVLGEQFGSKDHSLHTIIGWLITHSKTLDMQLVDLIIASEHRMFVDPLIAAMPQLNDETFCYLSEQLHYWFDEEEILPETKFTLVAPLLYQGLHGNSQRRLICAIEAVSFSEKTTIGASIVPLINDSQRAVAASAIRALGRLKYARASKTLENFCQHLAIDAVLLAAECQITLYKLGIYSLDSLNTHSLSTAPLSDSQGFMRLHPNRLLFDVSHMPLNLEQLKAYQSSPVTAHRYLAYQALLLQKHYRQLLTKSDLVGFAKQVRGSYSSQLDDLIRYAMTEDHSLTGQLLQLISNQGLHQLLDNVSNHQFASAIIPLCKIRPSFTEQCQGLFATDYRLKTLTTEKLISLPKVELYYLLAFSDKIKRQVLARRLIPQRDIQLLHFDNLYQSIHGVDPAWIEAFLAASFQQQMPINLKWLQEVSGQAFADQALGSWTQLYFFQQKIGE